MNIQTANRLLSLRQKAGFSQEELAEKIGVSRQAVSKWERGEAAPDIENLITLSKLYGVSIDEILLGKSENSIEQKDFESKTASSSKSSGSDNDKIESKSSHTGDFINFSDGIHVHTEEGDHVDISLKDGIQVKSKDGDNVKIALSGIHVDENGNASSHVFTRGKNKRDISAMHSAFRRFPYPILTVILFFFFSFFTEQGFLTSWLIFLTIPLYYTLVEAIFTKNANKFAYPVLVALVYLYLGMVFSAWHPLWILFLTIPIYYFFANPWGKNNSEK